MEPAVSLQEISDMLDEICGLVIPVVQSNDDLPKELYEAAAKLDKLYGITWAVLNYKGLNA